MPWNAIKKHYYHEKAKESLAEKLYVAEQGAKHGLKGPSEYTGAILQFEILLKIGKHQHEFERYVLEVDENFTHILSGTYQLSHGKGTYAEVVLKENELKTLVEYYKLDELDKFHLFHKKISG